MVGSSSATTARVNPSIGAPGAWTTSATASASDSLRTVCGVPPASGTTVPADAVTRLAGSSPPPR